jgi:putative tricarboxylic transport membrane protein
MFIRAPKDFWSGLMFIALAAVTLVTASGYSMGRGGRMGPGYFPTMLGFVLAGLGAILVIRSLIIHGERVERLHLKPLALLIGCVILFGVMIKPLGLVIALTITTFLAAFAGDETRWKEAGALSIGLTALSLLIFVYVLGLPLPVWPDL